MANEIGIVTEDVGKIGIFSIPSMKVRFADGSQRIYHRDEELRLVNGEQRPVRVGDEVVLLSRLL